jgi:nitrite reductase (NADH) small subunit
MNAALEATWINVCKTTDLVPQVGACAKVMDEQVAIFLIDEKVYAVDNLDPFSNANVLSRGIVGELGGKTVIASPVYKQHFDLETGECLEDAEVSIKTYAVNIENDQIQIATI